MSESAQQPKPLSTEERQALVNKMFQGIHADLGAVSRLLSSNPVEDGFKLDSAGVGAAQMRITRGMAALEQLLRMNGGLPPVKVSDGFKAGTAQDGALVATFAPAPAVQPLGEAIKGEALVGSTSVGSLGAANNP